MPLADSSRLIRRASEGLDAARHLIGGGRPPRTAAFWAQESARWAIGAALLADGRIGTSEDGPLDLARLLPPPLGLPDDDRLARLGRHDVDAQYPGAPDVTEEDAREAIETAETVLAAVRAALGA